MPERDVETIIGKMVLDEEFRKKMLNPELKEQTLASYRSQLTPKEYETLLNIRASKIEDFAQACIDERIVRT